MVQCPELALLLQRLRPDTQPEHQDPVSHTVFPLGAGLCVDHCTVLITDGCFHVGRCGRNASQLVERRGASQPNELQQQVKQRH